MYSSNFKRQIYSEKYQKYIYFIQLILSCLIAFFLPIYPSAVPPAIIIMSIICFFIKYEKNKILGHKNLIPLIALYLLHIVGLLYSADRSAAFWDLEIKLSLLILPLIFSFTPPFSIKHYHWLLLSFAISCLIAVLYCLKNSFYNYYYEAQWIEQFWGYRFSKIMHLGYFAMYLNFSIAILFYLIFYYWNTANKRILALAIIGVLILFIGVILTTSMNGILTLFVTFIITGLYLIIARKLYFGGIFLITLSLVLILFGVKFADKISEKFSNTYNVLAQPPDNPEAVGSSLVRTYVWKASAEIIKQHPIAGVGTGDVKHELMKHYKNYGYTGAIKRNLNSHNQYLQTFAALGISGITLLLSSYFFTFFNFLRQKKLLAVLFITIISIASLTESILEVSAGVIFFSFFVSIINTCRKK